MRFYCLCQRIFKAEPKGLLVGVLPLREGDDGNATDLGLACPLKVHLIQQELHGLFRRVAIGEVMGE